MLKTAGLACNNRCYWLVSGHVSGCHWRRALSAKLSTHQWQMTTALAADVINLTVLQSYEW